MKNRTDKKNKDKKADKADKSQVKVEKESLRKLSVRELADVHGGVTCDCQNSGGSEVAP